MKEVTNPAAITEALERVLASDAFVSSPKLSSFLTYVVREALSSDETRITAYSIGIDALDRPDSFDPDIDSIVRVTANRVRAALDNYYETDGRSDPVRIRIPKGRYVPRIEQNAANDLNEPVAGLDASAGRRFIFSWYRAQPLGPLGQLALVAVVAVFTLLSCFIVCTYSGHARAPTVVHGGDVKASSAPRTAGVSCLTLSATYSEP